jgi:hypothetical protein
MQETASSWKDAKLAAWPTVATAGPAGGHVLSANQVALVHLKTAAERPVVAVGDVAVSLFVIAIAAAAGAVGSADKNAVAVDARQVAAGDVADAIVVVGLDAVDEIDDAVEAAAMEDAAAVDSGVVVVAVVAKGAAAVGAAAAAARATVGADADDSLVGPDGVRYGLDAASAVEPGTDGRLV